MRIIRDEQHAAARSACCHACYEWAIAEVRVHGPRESEARAWLARAGYQIEEEEQQ